MTDSRAVVTWVVAVAFVVALFGSAFSEPNYAHTGPTLITNVTVNDGLGNPPVAGQDIALVDGTIATIGARSTVAVPVGALTIDGTGMMPCQG